MRTYQKFTWKEANFRISSSHFDTITTEIKKQREILDNYIKRDPTFLKALSPITLLPDAPEIAHRMHKASHLTDTGPMAAVAGTFAQMAAEIAIEEGVDVIVENGGDIFVSTKDTTVIGLYAGQSSISGQLAFSIETENMPLALCSSSSLMGHSLSFGNCDLVTVTSKNSSLADAAATAACNLVKHIDDVSPTLEKFAAIPGIEGILIVKDGKVGLAGNLPKLIRHSDTDLSQKITRAEGVAFN